MLLTAYSNINYCNEISSVADTLIWLQYWKKARTLIIKFPIQVTCLLKLKVISHLSQIESDTQQSSLSLWSGEVWQPLSVFRGNTQRHVGSKFWEWLRITTAGRFASWTLATLIGPQPSLLPLLLKTAPFSGDSCDRPYSQPTHFCPGLPVIRC